MQNLGQRIDQTICAPNSGHGRWPDVAARLDIIFVHMSMRSSRVKPGAEEEREDLEFLFENAAAALKPLKPTVEAAEQKVDKTDDSGRQEAQEMMPLTLRLCYDQIENLKTLEPELKVAHVIWQCREKSTAGHVDGLIPKAVGDLLRICSFKRAQKTACKRPYKIWGTIWRGKRKTFCPGSWQANKENHGKSGGKFWYECTFEKRKKVDHRPSQLSPGPASHRSFA